MNTRTPQTTQTYPLYEFGGEGPIVHLAVGNGFPPQCYTPFVEPLLAHYRVVCLPPRALWGHGGDPRQEVRTWRNMADDLLEGLTRHHLTDVIAIGHSMGGVASMLAVIIAPERFRALILLDPTILPPEMLNMIKEARAQGLADQFPLVQRALNRRSEFASPEAAFSYFRSKALFNQWSDRTLRLYVEGLTQLAPGGGVDLAWTPAWEAQYYKTIFAGSWIAVPHLRGLRPGLVIRGEVTDTFVAESAERFATLAPDFAQAVIPAHGHLFPQSAPEQTAHITLEWLQQTGLLSRQPSPRGDW